ncbi:MAG: recombinase family protein [Acidobacteria bacterium]|nr:recombinase family protein [Acidobacteriota bacterium]
MAKSIVSPARRSHPRAALYARVSTSNHQNPEMQLGELREYCQRRGWEVAGEYVDNGVSGAKERRPLLDRLLSDCRRRAVDAVVVNRYDRFARSLRQLVNALEEFRSLGIDFISLHEGVDTSTPNGRLVFGIFASIAEFERELIRNRVKSGIAAASA